MCIKVIKQFYDNILNIFNTRHMLTEDLEKQLIKNFKRFSDFNARDKIAQKKTLMK